LKFSTLFFLLICTQIGRAADPLDTWTWRSPLPAHIPLNSMTYGNGQFVAVGYNNDGSAPILTFADGVAWVQRHSGTITALYDIAYGNGQFVAVGGTWDVRVGLTESAVISSIDGKNWVRHSSGVTNGFGLTGIAYGSGQFVAVGDRGTIV